MYMSFQKLLSASVGTCKITFPILKKQVSRSLITSSNQSLQRTNLQELRLSSLVCQSQPLCTSAKSEISTVVYTGAMQRKVLRVKLFSFATSGAGVYMQVKIFNGCASLPTFIAASSVVGFFTFVTPFLLHMVAKRYVFQITHDKEKDEYIADVLTFLCRRKQIHFKPGEARIPDVGGMLTTVEVKGTPLLIDFSAVDAEHCKRILGFDKPLDIGHESIAEDLRKAEKSK